MSSFSFSLSVLSFILSPSFPLPFFPFYSVSFFLYFLKYFFFLFPPCIICLICLFDSFLFRFCLTWSSHVFLPIRNSCFCGFNLFYFIFPHKTISVFFWIHYRFFQAINGGSNNYEDGKVEFVAERTPYFCLARKLIWLLWSSHICTQLGWLILFSPGHFLRQHKNGKSPLNYHFLRTFRAGRTYFLSAPFIAAESQHHEESRLIYGPLSLPS